MICTRILLLSDLTVLLMILQDDVVDLINCYKVIVV